MYKLPIRDVSWTVGCYVNWLFLSLFCDDRPAQVLEFFGVEEEGEVDW